MAFTFKLPAAVVSLVSAATILAGCNRSPLIADDTVQPVLPASEAAPCDVKAEGVWTNEGYGRMRTRAVTSGPSCADAVVLLTVRNELGAPLLAWASPTAAVFGLKDAATPAAMKDELARWIRQDQASLARTRVLPEWPEGQETPASGEFPFYPEDWLDREAWAELRERNAPLFAFPQGHESMAVYMLQDAGLELIGVQLFPG